MYTISDILKVSLRTFILLLIPVLVVLKPVTLKAQSNSIVVTVAVTPPYSTKISDYTSNPGKILVYIRNISPAGGTAMIYLQGSITGESGIRVATEEGYKPLQPLAVPPGQQVMLNVDNIGDVFDENHLTYEGITREEIISGNGLPEDFYTICLRAYNYYNDEPLSAEEPSGCSAPFHVMDVEPPMITSPLCGEEINVT
ncbi:MAG: TANFOR domain-containing protein, partial [Chloroflexota bacterium]